MNISRPFIERPVATALLMAAVLLSGILAYRLLPVSALPQVDYPTIRILTFYPGASPEVMAQKRVMSSIEVCRTAALGGHLERCDECGHERNCFNSCRDRHCPKCQSLARAEWIQDRQSELLEVPYFHVVFTVPEEIAAITSQNKKVVYNILFRMRALSVMYVRQPTLASSSS